MIAKNDLRDKFRENPDLVSLAPYHSPACAIQLESDGSNSAKRSNDKQRRQGNFKGEWVFGSSLLQSSGISSTYRGQHSNCSPSYTN